MLVSLILEKEACLRVTEIGVQKPIGGDHGHLDDRLRQAGFDEADAQK